MTLAADLYALQEIDSAIDTAQTRLALVKDQLGEMEELIACRQAVAEKREALRRLREEQKEQEYLVEEVRPKAGAIEKKLYGGTIRNPKELQDLQADLQILQRQVRQREDGLLNVMVQVEEAEAGLKEAQETLAAVEARWKEEQESLKREEEQLSRELAALTESRGQRLASVEQGALGLYERVRERRQGQAVAKVERGMCQGCRITLPVSVLQKARSGAEVVQCVSCERILYVS